MGASSSTTRIVDGVSSEARCTGERASSVIGAAHTVWRAANRYTRSVGRVFGPTRWGRRAAASGVSLSPGRGGAMARSSENGGFDVEIAAAAAQVARQILAN